ncbi:MAG: DUF655 domain-containing protein [Nanoarchaeota archaeon]|nr:DUF655 domain-containing protein [Nanoarchaeota archaeon]
MEKEEKAIILDYLPHGYFGQEKRIPTAQAIGTSNFTLLQLVPRKGATFQLKEEVYIGTGKRDKVNYILGRLPGDKLTETSKINLKEFVNNAVEQQQKRFVDFFNKAEPVNTRLHQIELLPGFGRKHTDSIVKEREIKSFESFSEMHERIKSLPDVKKAIEKRILDELEKQEKYKLFVK